MVLLLCPLNVLEWFYPQRRGVIAKNAALSQQIFISEQGDLLVYPFIHSTF